MTSAHETGERSFPDPVQSLVQQLLNWLSDPAAVPIAYIDSSDVGSRYFLGQVLDRALYIRFDGRDPVVERIYAQANMQDVPRLLILDEIDRANEHDLLGIITWLRAARPGLRLVLMGRRIPSRLRRDPALENQIRFFPQSEFNQASRKLRLQVRTLGTLLVEHDGIPITAWEGRQTRLLFLFCIDRAIVGRQSVFTAFWPNESVKNATNVFHVTKLKLKQVLGGHSLIVYSKGYYRIDPAWDIVYDVARFIDCVQHGELMDAIDPDQAEHLFREAAQIYQGDYLSGFSEPWVVSRRRELRAINVRVLLRLARFATVRGDAAEAETLLRRALWHDPQSSAALIALTDMLVSQARHAEAMQVLKQAHNQSEASGQALDPALRKRLNDLDGASGGGSID